MKYPNPGIRTPGNKKKGRAGDRDRAFYFLSGEDPDKNKGDEPMNTNRFSKVNRVVTCRTCGKRTTSNAGSGSTCGRCYDAAGLENEHSDGCHDSEPHPRCLIRRHGDSR